MNRGPWYDTISSEIPKLQKIYYKRASAVSITNARPVREINLQALEKQSTATKICINESDGGRSVTKSTPKCDQGRCGMGNG